MSKIIKILLIFCFLPLVAFCYSPVCPYTYGSSNPIKYIDPTGENVVILNFTEGQHIAMLIQDQNGKWQYYSVNGNNVTNPITGNHSGGRPFNDVAVGSWDTPQQFLNSSYNVRDENSKEDNNKNHFGYKEGYMIKSSPEQDEKMRNSFIERSKENYTILGNNCATAVQHALFDADIPVSEPAYKTIYSPANIYLGEPEYKTVIPNFSSWPKSAFKSIMKVNPNGTYIHK